MKLLQKVRENIKRDELLATGDSVLVALSGGPDSVALLHLLTRLRKSYTLSLEAVYVNHQIRPKAAQLEEEFCRQLCHLLGVGFSLVRHDIPAVAKSENKSVEEAARDFRYAAFEFLANELSCDRIALGHHADDQVETILFRLCRGTGPAGLRGMPVKRGHIIRPLLELTKAEILQYLKENSLEFCEDRSNRSLQYSRNLIRHKLLPLMRDKLNPQVSGAILSLAETVARDEAFFDSLVDRAVKKSVRYTPGGKLNLDLAPYNSYSEAVRLRLLRRCLKATCHAGQFPDKVTVERLDRLASGGNGALSLPGRLEATVVGSRLWIGSSPRQKVRVSFNPGHKLELDWPAVRLVGKVVESDSAVIPSRPQASRAVIDYERVKPPFEVRTIRPGDRFRPLGMNGHKKVGDFLTDHKIPRPIRDEILLLCDQNGIIWVIGYEIAERVRVTDKTRKVLSVAVAIRKTKDRPAV